MDAEGLPAVGEVAVPVPFRPADIHHDAVPGLDPALRLVPGVAGVGGRGPVDRLEVVQQGLRVVLDRGHPVVRPALLDQQAGRCGLGVHRLQGDGPALKVQLSEQAAHRGDLVGAVRHFGLPQGDAGAVLEGRDQDERALAALPGRATEGLAVQGHRGLAAPLPLPAAHRLLDRVGRHRRQEVAERRLGGHRVDAPARAVEASDRPALLLGQRRGELADGLDPAVSGPPAGPPRRSPCSTPPDTAGRAPCGNPRCATGARTGSTAG